MAKRKTKTDDREIETHNTTWQGVALTISFERNWLNMPPSAFSSAHLEIESSKREKLPVTETGFRSHFLAAEEIDAAGGPVAYVLAWLDEAAESKGWKASVEASRQLSLF